MSQLSHLGLAGLLRKTAQVARSEEELVWKNSLALSGLSIRCADGAWLLSRRINNRLGCKRCLVLCYRSVLREVLSVMVAVW
ncbi:uncharacterized protein B0T23DRAFT_381963 [Neurospora hispaniola]|uniref:Uncharacterized protein n=1 Tax=Neurospora hispaniola TaxID=588809 RepID=A0AAJ0I5A4_9PEZI|nr:hypothetical protein B0T23DRAFT_381963 [Neurospora hispaniola]